MKIVTRFGTLAVWLQWRKDWGVSIYRSFDGVIRQVHFYFPVAGQLWWKPKYRVTDPCPSCGEQMEIGISGKWCHSCHIHLEKKEIA